MGDGVVYCAQPFTDQVFAFDGKSGKHLWVHTIRGLNDPEPFAFSKSILYIAEDAVVDLGNYATLYALDGKTGEEKWKFMRGDYMSAPTISGQRVYITSGYRAAHRADTLYALDISTGKVVGQIQLTGAVTHPKVLEQGTVFYASQDLDVLTWWVSAIH